MASSTTDGTHVVHKATSAELRTTDIGVTAMAVVFVVLRFLSRWQRHARFGADDYLIAVSLVATIMFIAEMQKADGGHNSRFYSFQI